MSKSKTVMELLDAGASAKRGVSCRLCAARVVCAVLLSVPAWAKTLTLVRGKRLGILGETGSAYCIYAAPGAPSSVRLAAAEMQRAVRLSTGVELPITDRPKRPMVCLGDNAAARDAGMRLDELPDDAFRILTRDRDLYIAGRDTADDYHWKGWESRGTLYGAYEFLERVVGVRWLLPGDVGEEIPVHRTLAVPDLDVTEIPAFEMRELVDVQNQIRSPNPRDSMGHLDVDRWLLRHKCANVSDGFKSSRQRVLHGHAWATHIPRDELKAHPGWQAVSGSPGKFCTSNPEAVECFAQRVIAWLDEHPRSRSAPISPEDGGNFCRCDKCKARTEMDWHGKLSYAPVILSFYNDVAKIVAGKHPDRLLGGYVYYNYMYPPSSPPRMEPNVYLYLAPLNYYGWGLAKPVYREELPKLVSEWRAITPNLCYFNWSVWFRSLNGTPLPPGLPLLKLELPTLHRGGVKGAGMVGIGAWGYGGCENYILAKLLWNADADVDALYREWMRTAYGPAWRIVDRLTMMIEARVLERKREETPKYSGDNYEVNYDFVETVYKPVFDDIERLYLRALAEVATGKQRRRLEMLGDNLVMLHYNMRKADMFAEAEESVFYRNDEAYVQFLADTEYSLALYRDHGHRDTPLLYHGSFSARAASPPMEVRKLTVGRIGADNAPPAVDGELSDPAWQTAVAADEFRKIGGRDASETPTTARLLFDHKALYIGVSCQVVDPTRIVAEAKERDGNVFGDDCVEVFLAVFPKARAKYWHLTLTAGNTQWDGIGNDVGKDLDWTSAVGRSGGNWTAEIAIPFRSLGMAAAPAGVPWHANVTRTERGDGGARFSSWNAVHRGFNEPYSFGEWHFAP